MSAFAFASSGAAVAAPARHATMVLDANTGNVLHNEDGDAPRHPASLTKMMTLYLTFEMLESGRLKMSDDIVMSEAAAAVAPSKLDLDPGERISVRNAIGALITKSANDVAVALAEKIGGSESNFARLMTARARDLGMTRTSYVNASGLPDDRQVTTARDMITLALHLQDDFPSYYPLFSTRTFTYGRKTYRNHNTMLNSFAGVDGIKTGYTRSSGFNLVTSFHRGRKHLIGAVFGGASAATRNAEMRVLLTRALRKASPNKSRKPSALLVAKLRAPPRPATRALARAPKAVAMSAPPDPKPFAPAARPVPAIAPVAERPRKAVETASAADILAVMRASEPQPIPAPPADQADPAPAAENASPGTANADIPIEIFKVRKVAILGSKAKVSPDETTDMDASDSSDTVETAYSGDGRTDFGKFPDHGPDKPRTLADKLAQAFGDANTPADAETFIPKLASADRAAEPGDQKMSLLGPAAAAEASPQVMPVAYSAPDEAEPAPPENPAPSLAPAAPPRPEPAPEAHRTRHHRGAPPSTLQAQAMALGGKARAADHGKQTGGYLVQVGAYGSADDAQHALQTIRSRAGTLLAGVAPVTQSAEKNGHQIYRARFAGFSADRAASTCTALRRQSVDCFVMAAD